MSGATQKMWKPGEPAPPGVQQKAKKNKKKNKKQGKRGGLPAGDLSALQRLQKGDLQAAAEALLRKSETIRAAAAASAAARAKRKAASHVAGSGDGSSSTSSSSSPRPARSFSEKQPKAPATKQLSSSVRNLKFMARKATQAEARELQRKEREKLRDMHWVVEQPPPAPSVRGSGGGAVGISSSCVGARSLVPPGVVAGGAVLRVTVDERVGRDEDIEEGGGGGGGGGSREAGGDPAAPACRARRSFGRFNARVERAAAGGGGGGGGEHEEDGAAATAEEMASRFAEISGGSMPMHYRQQQQQQQPVASRKKKRGANFGSNGGGGGSGGKRKRKHPASRSRKK